MLRKEIKLGQFYLILKIKLHIRNNLKWALNNKYYVVLPIVE